MKTKHFTQLMITVCSLAAFSTAGCAEKAPTAEAASPPAQAPAADTPEAGKAAPVPNDQVVTTASPAVKHASWMDLKDYTYDQRNVLLSGLKGLEARVDLQIVELTAQRAAMARSTDTKGWDLAMKEMEDARSYLKAMGMELDKATYETWDQAKNRVGRAWVRTQDAYGKVKSSTTS